MSKKVLYAKEAREKILAGVRAISRAVKVTLGPAGRNVLVSKTELNSYGAFHHPLHLTKDGVTVAKAFELEDAEENVGARLIKEAAQKTVEQAGDSTTTTCVLAEAILEAGIGLVDDGGFNPVLVKKGINAMAAKVAAEMKKISMPVAGDLERIRQVATVSANNDGEIGKLLHDTYKKIGEDGIVRLEESKTTQTKVKITDGFMLSRGFIHQNFITNEAKGICEFPNAKAPNDIAILLFDRPITQMKQIMAVAEQVSKAGKSLLIIAEDVDAEALAFLLRNNANGGLAVCAIKSPYEGGEKRDHAMEDIALLTGATYFSNLTGSKLENAKMSDLGTAKKVIVTKTETTIIDGAYDEEKRQERLDKLQKAKEAAETDEEREYIELRIARLKGAVAMIEVGGATETEMLERKDRIDDAIRSVKAALIEGFVPGGGTAFIRASAHLTVSKDQPTDFQRGEEIVLKSLEAPLYNICVNAGVQNPSEIVLQVIGAGEQYGYNAQKEVVENLVESGIIDATKVLNAALINGASVAGSILTTESLICNTY